MSTQTVDNIPRRENNRNQTPLFQSKENDIRCVKRINFSTFLF